jgi:flagellar basal body-associated protein FliL
VKGECRQCRGHLEFPAGAAGETIQCPHCGQPTELVASVPLNKKNGSSRIWLRISLVVFIVAAGLAAVLFFAKKPGQAGVSETQNITAARSNTPTVASASPVIQNNPPVETLTNEFGLLPFQLERTPGSSLVYVTGTIRNLSSRQRFGVKVEFGLFGTNDIAVGKAADYQPMLDPHGDWHFKALVIESKAASARLDSIVEQE